MENNNKISISLNTVILIGFCILALIVGVVCYFIFNKKTDTPQTNSEQLASNESSNLPNNNSSIIDTNNNSNNSNGNSNTEKKNNIKIKIQRRRNMRKDQKGITIIALVITIIVLLIIAGISIRTITSDNRHCKRSRK